MLAEYPTPQSYLLMFP